MTTVAAVHTALPPHRYPQDRLTEPIGDLCLPPGADRAVLRRLHASSGVRTRHLALPIERYAALRGFRESNEAWLTAGLDLAGRALTTALDQAGLAPADVDLLVCASITGVAAPSLDARLAGRVGLRPDVKRLPVFGLGCAAGAAPRPHSTTTCVDTPAKPPCCSPSNCARSPCRRATTPAPTWSPAPSSATERRPSSPAPPPVRKRNRRRPPGPPWSPPAATSTRTPGTSSAGTSAPAASAS
ncbi:hypothetical protein SALBM217S_05223 [Streptomyces griseoloalbus]